MITSLIDTAGFGLLFWLFDLPAPTLWTVVMFVLSLLPIVGAGLVWVPAVIYLAIGGQWLGAAAVLAWGLFTFLAINNALYARLAGTRMRMHPVPTLVGFLGGLMLFGVSGVILGPAAMAVTAALLKVWQGRLACEATPAPPAMDQPVGIQGL